jgi:diguanylate cyclase (GGDEF)-like protein
MTLDETELRILEQFVARYEAVGASGQTDKCAQELSMRDVVHSVTGKDGPQLDQQTRFWFQRLVARPSSGQSASFLRPCSRGEHKEGARAYVTGGNALAWERIQELQRRLGHEVSGREREQKFGILWSSGQAFRDFHDWTNNARSSEVPVVIAFLDIDHFKSLNTKFTETVVDRSLFPAFQNLLEAMVRHRGYAYREGGEEFLVLLANHTIDEALVFAERIRRTIAAQEFVVDTSRAHLTISLGLARFPDDGGDYDAVKLAANQAKEVAKRLGRDRVVTAEVSSKGLHD